MMMRSAPSQNPVEAVAALRAALPGTVVLVDDPCADTNGDGRAPGAVPPGWDFLVETPRTRPWPADLAVTLSDQTLGMAVSTRWAHEHDLAKLALDRLCDRIAHPDVLVERLRLPLHEALANAVLHGNLNLDGSLRTSIQGFKTFVEQSEQRLADPAYADRWVILSLRQTPDRVHVMVRDEGQWQKTGTGPVSSDLHAPSGRGLSIIREFAETVALHQAPTRIMFSIGLEAGNGG